MINSSILTLLALAELAFFLMAPSLNAQSLPVANPGQSLVLKMDGTHEIRFQHPNSPNIVQATTIDGQHLDLSFNEDATEVRLAMPEGVESDQVRVLTCEESEQFSDGTIVFSALDAKIHGEIAKLETHPGSHRIGYWSNAKDFVTWEFKPQRWGRYDVELIYSNAGKSGNEIYANFESTDQDPSFEAKLSATLQTTDSWYKYRVASLGEIYIDDQSFKQSIRLSVGSIKKVSGAVMNLKAILLRPKCEGETLIEADGDAKLTFLAKDATVCGVQLVYEPNPKKNTLGWWVVPTDKVRWKFKVDQAQTFSVETLQGCGAGQGGSRVAIEVLKQNAPTLESAEGEETKWTVAKTEFIVEGTGDFQNYKSRTIGELKLEPGTWILQVRPLSIASKAVMDLRKLILTPVD